MTIINLQSSDITIDVVSSPKVTPSPSPGGEHLFFSGGNFSKAGASLKPLDYIINTGTVKVGKVSPPDTAGDTWQFGFIQACEAKQALISYSGASYLQGSVLIDLLPSDTVFAPDGFGLLDATIDPRVANSRPYTRPPGERFKFDAGKGTVSVTTSDGPAGFVPTKMNNTVTHVDNFLRSVIDRRTFCCALVVEELKASPQRRIVSHQMWEIKYAFEFKWRNKSISSIQQTGASITVGKFVFGPPTLAPFTNMLDGKFLGSTVINDVFRERWKDAKTGVSKKFRSDTDTTTAGRDFFT